MVWDQSNQYWQCWAPKFYVRKCPYELIFLAHIEEIHTKIPKKSLGPTKKVCPLEIYEYLGLFGPVTKGMTL